MHNLLNNLPAIKYFRLDQGLERFLPERTSRIKRREDASFVDKNSVQKSLKKTGSLNKNNKSKRKWYWENSFWSQ